MNAYTTFRYNMVYIWRFLLPSRLFIYEKGDYRTISPHEKSQSEELSSVKTKEFQCVTQMSRKNDPRQNVAPNMHITIEEKNIIFFPNIIVLFFNARLKSL